MRNAQDVDVLAHRRNGLVWALPVVAVVAVADQVTKRWALDNLTATSCDVPDACIDLFGGAKLHLVFNTGAAFARGQGFGPVLGVAVAIITVALLVAAAMRSDRLGPILLGLVAGGALGNLFDRLTRADDGFLSGAVVDFIDLGWWPVFNVADSAVVGGVIGFVVLSWLQPEPDPERESQSGDDDDPVDVGEPEDTVRSPDHGG